MRNGTVFFGIISLTYFLISVVQWFFKYPDPSQLFLSMGVTLCLLAITYFWEITSHDGEQLHYLRERLDSLVYQQKGEEELAETKKQFKKKK